MAVFVLHPRQRDNPSDHGPKTRTRDQVSPTGPYRARLGGTDDQLARPCTAGEYDERLSFGLRQVRPEFGEFYP